MSLFQNFFDQIQQALKTQDGSYDKARVFLGGVAGLIVGVGSYFLAKRVYVKSTQKWSTYTTADDALQGVDLTGKYAIVTGCNTGLGKETVRAMAAKGCHIIMACRTESRALNAKKDIIQQIGGNSNDLDSRLQFIPLDLGSLKSVENFVKIYNQKFKDAPLHFLINNAGIMALPNFEKSDSGFEKQFGTNHIGHFHLTNLLLGKLKANATRERPTLVINLSSSAAAACPPIVPMIEDWIERTDGPSEQNYNEWNNYYIAKMCNVLHAREITERYKDSNVIGVSLHPGGIMTELSRHMKIGVGTMLWGLSVYHRFKNVKQGAAPACRCVALTNTEIEQIKRGDLSGYFWEDCNDGNHKLNIENQYQSRPIKQIQSKFWELSEQLVTNGLQFESRKTRA